MQSKLCGHHPQKLHVLTDSPTKGEDSAMVALHQEASAPLKKEKAKVCHNQRLRQPICLPSRLKERIHWWAKRAPPHILQLITHGVCPDWPEPELELHPCHRSQEEEKAASQLMAEYVELGAAQPVSDMDKPSRFLIPWFLIRKADVGGGEKVRLIADCRQLNRFLFPPHFRLDHWADIFPYLRKGMWGAKVDLKHAYFHLANSEKLLPYMRINIGEKVYQMNSAVFGLNVLPQLFTGVMKVLQKDWRKQGFLVFVYLDDILILGTTKHQTQKVLQKVLQTLEISGFLINQKKSHLEPTQTLEHLGFQIHFQEGFLGVPPEKLKSVRRELGKLIVHQTMSPRKMAAILGQVRSFLTAMPFLRAFTNQMLSFVDHQKTMGWDCHIPVPQSLQEEVKKIKNLMLTWKGRIFQGHCPVRELHSDSSNHAWAGVDLTGKQEVQEFWRDKSGLHINVKELLAAVSTLKSLARPKEHVTLAVDNSVAFSYLRKGGGKKHYLNLLMQDLWHWCMEKSIHLHPILVPSKECQADSLSRTPLDKGDYTLCNQVFHKLLDNFRGWATPDWDIFASPGNHKFPKFICRYPHWQASLTDALHCPLENIQCCYANPPWTCISQGYTEFGRTNI